MRTIQRVAVLGAGTMGSRIAAHFANAGIPSVLLDVSTALAAKGVENAAKQRPGGFFTESAAAMISTGSFDQDLPKIADCDWIMEAVTENLEIKRALWKKVEALRKAGFDRFHEYQWNPAAADLRRVLGGFSQAFPGHALFQSAAVSASARIDSGRRHRP